MTRSQPNKSLVSFALDGDDQAVDQLARAWLPHVYRWCHRLGGPQIDAEGAAHDALIIMVRKLDTVQSAEQFPAWLYGITKRVIANKRRKAWFRRWVGAPTHERPSPNADPHQNAEAAEASATVWAILETLSPNEREVLVLCELEERTGAEVAALTGLPLGTVKSRLRTARASFRTKLETQRRAASPVASR